MDFLPKVTMDFEPDIDDSSPDYLATSENYFATSKITRPLSDPATSDPTTSEIDDDNITVQFEDEIIVEPVKKSDSINPEEIFSLNEEEKKKLEPEPEPSPNIRLTKKGKPFKKRPPMSEAHKLKLKSAREKAIAVRRAKAQVKKEDKLLDKKTTELLRTKKKKEVDRLEKEVNDDDIVAHHSAQGVDIEKAVLDGIAKYEVLRKQRKKEKQETQKKTKEENEMKDKLRRAIAPQKPFNPYANCY